MYARDQQKNILIKVAVPAPSLPQSLVCTALAAPGSSFLAPILGSCPHNHPFTPSSREHTECSPFCPFTRCICCEPEALPRLHALAPGEEPERVPVPAAQPWDSCGVPAAAPCNSPHPRLPWERFIKAQPSPARSPAPKLFSCKVQRRLTM